jgi:subtilisin family serine protease
MLEYVPGQLIVRVHAQAVRPSVGAARLSMTAASARLVPDVVAEPLNFLAREAGVREARPLFAPSRATTARLARPDQLRLAVARSVAESESEELAGLTVIELSRKQVSAKTLERVASSPGIEFVEQMPARWLAASPAANPSRNRQWGLRAVRWFEAAHPDAGGVTSAVLDSGIDEGHPELSGAIDRHERRGLSARDIIGHGTHVAGIIAAATSDSAGITGVANCRLAIWKVFPDEPTQGDFYVDGTRYLRALNEVIVAGAKVLNLSLGGTARSQTEQLLFNRLERFGVTVVAAMGNDFERGNPIEYPAGYDTILAVGSIAENDQRSPFSNTGRQIGLVAPGSNVLSTLPRTRSDYRADTNYAAWSGTSMATPHVAGAAASIIAKHADWSATDVKEHLRSTAAKLNAMQGKTRTEAYGNGLLDLRAALS